MISSLFDGLVAGLTATATLSVFVMVARRTLATTPRRRNLSRSDAMLAVLPAVAPGAS